MVLRFPCRKGQILGVVWPIEKHWVYAVYAAKEITQSSIMAFTMQQAIVQFSIMA